MKIDHFLVIMKQLFWSTIKNLVNKFKLLRQVSDQKNETLVRRSKTAENIDAVAETGGEKEVSCRYLELGIPQTIYFATAFQYLITVLIRKNSKKLWNYS